MKARDGVDPEMEWRSGRAGSPFECRGMSWNAKFVSSAIKQRPDRGRVAKRFYLEDTFNSPVVTQFSGKEVGLGRLQLAGNAMARDAYVTDVDRVRANFAE